VPHRYRFDDVQIDLQSFRLLKAGKVVPVEPKALNLLVFLAENRGRLVERRELIDAVWGDAFVTGHVLNYAIGQLRKGLTDDPKNPKYIETVPTLGYRFIADVEVELPNEAVKAPMPATLERILGKTTAPPQSPAESSVPVAGEGVREASSRLRRTVAVFLGIALLGIAAGVLFWIKGRGGRLSGSESIRSLAVLPLANLSGDSSQDYLADGTTDQLITGLGQISALRVISRTTAMVYKNAHKPLPQIAKELDVDAIVEGSVERSGDRIRIAAQLIAAPADKQLWAHSYEGDLADILGLQSQVASAVADQIRIKLTAREHTQLADTRQVNPRAYDAYLKGHFFEQNTPETLQKSIQFYKQAVELDPKFARAYVGLARDYNYLAGTETVPPGEAAANADAAIARALELDPDLAEDYDERAWTLQIYRWDFTDADRDFRHALELDPGSSDAHSGLSANAAILTRTDESLREIRKAMELDPLSLEINADYCRSLWVLRKYDEAIAQCQATLELDPNFKYALSYMGEFYARKGKYAEAHKVWERYGGCDASCMAMRDEIYGAPGVAGAFDAWLKAQKEQPDAFFLAQAYTGLGRKDEAFSWIEKAYETRAGMEELRFLSIDPDFDSLRSDPRFDAFLRHAGLPPQPRDILAQADRPSN